MLSAEAATKPRISVLIPVYRDWAGLDLCLAALAAQTWPADDFEVLAISNDVEPPPALSRPGVQLLHEPRGHSYAARNAGLAMARGEVLAFTDADCCPEPGWLAAGWAALQANTEASLVGGNIRIAVTQRNVATDYDESFAFKQAETVRNGGSVTANLFVKRAVFDAVGPFNAALQSGGDFELCRRAKQSGFKIIYAADAVVQHPARDSLAALFRKNRRVAGGFRRREFDLLSKGFAARLRFVANMLKPRLRFWLRLMRGQSNTDVLPTWRRPAVVVVQILMHYHFAFSVLLPPPRKDQH